MTIDRDNWQRDAERLERVNIKLLAAIDEIPTNPHTLAGARAAIEFAKNRARVAITVESARKRMQA